MSELSTAVSGGGYCTLHGPYYTYGLCPSCSTTVPPMQAPTQVATSLDPTPAYHRIAAALERIAAALEKGAT